MPVAAIAGKTRRLDREHSADTAVADRCEQPLEAGTRDAATGAAEVVVDDIDVAPAKPETMLLADRGCDADWIRELARQQGAWAKHSAEAQPQKPYLL